MKITTVYFDRGNQKYKRLLNVFYNSAIHYMPEADIKIYQMKVKEKITRKHDMAEAFLFLAKKTLGFKKITAICDVDLMFVNPIDSIKEKEFDIAITMRKFKHPYNSGVWFFNPTDKARLFVNKWIENTKYLINNYDDNLKLINKHAGIDQASQSMTVEQLKNEVNIIKLPCQEWNATQSEWHLTDKNTKIIHIKSKLRDFCMKNKKVPKEQKHLRSLVKQWKKFSEM